MAWTKHYTFAVVFSGWALAVCGCSQFVPKSPYYREAPVGALSLAQEQAYENAPVAPEEWPDENWWDQFSDSQLSSLIERALADHPSMKVAEARVGLAAAAVKRERAPLFPMINATGDYTRWRNSKNGIFGLAPQFPLTYTQPEASINFSYEFDFWRKHANSAGAALDEMHAREAEAYQSALLLSLSVAQAYFEWQVGKEREELAKDALENRRGMALLSAQRKANGLDNRWAVNIAKTGIQATLQYYELVTEETAKSGYALQALLAGEFDVLVTCGMTDNWMRFPMPLPDTLPLDLLGHRADVWALRWRAEAAAKQICVARAGFYPNINLLAFGGLQSIVPSKFFEANSFYGQVGPAFQLPIFQGGALEANLQASHQNAALAIAEYEGGVLQAVQEVLTALSSLDKAQKRYEEALTAEKFAFDSLGLAQQRLINNVDSRSDLLLYEYEWLQARDGSLKAFLAALKSRLELVRAIGGSFNTPGCG